MLTKKLFEEAELLSRHITILQVVKENQPIGITRIARILNMGTHEVRHSLAVLERNGLIRPTSGGAVISDGYREKVISIAEDIQQMEETLQLVRSRLLRLVV